MVLRWTFKNLSTYLLKKYGETHKLKIASQYLRCDGKTEGRYFRTHYCHFFFFFQNRITRQIGDLEFSVFFQRQYFPCRVDLQKSVFETKRAAVSCVIHQSKPFYGSTLVQKDRTTVATLKCSVAVYYSNVYLYCCKSCSQTG